MDQPVVVASPARGHQTSEVILRRANCPPCCRRITYACVQENCALNFYDFTLRLHFVLLTDAVAVHVLYCRFLKEKI